MLQGSNLIKKMAENTAEVVFEVKVANKRPTIASLAYPFYVPHKAEENKCHSIASLMESTPKKYEVGQSVLKKITAAKKVFFPIFKDDDPKETAGFAIAALKGEGFKYRCTKEGDVKDLTISRGKVLVLSKACCIKFEPKDDKVWGVNDVEFHAHAFDGSDLAIVSGGELATENIADNTAFSSNKMVAKILRENCDGDLGYKCPVKKCQRGQIERK